MNSMTGTSRFVRLMAVAAVVAASGAACGSSSTTSTSAWTIVATLAAQPSGMVALDWDPQTKNVRAKLAMTGFTPGTRHALHIHQGSCAAQGDVQVPFPDVTANDVGAIDTTVTSSQPAPDGLAAGTLLNIHLAPAAQLGDPGSLGYTPISCADVDPAASAPLTMAAPPQPGQRPQGSAKLTYDPANKTLGVDVTASGLVAGSAHAVHIHLGSCDSQGAVKYPLNDLVALPAGTAEATTVIQNVDQAPRRRAGTSTSTSDRPARSNKMGSPPFISSPSSAATSASRFHHGPAPTRRNGAVCYVHILAQSSRFMPFPAASI